MKNGIVNSLAVMTAVICVGTGCSRQRPDDGRYLALKFVVDGYDNVCWSKSSVVSASGAETMISDCNIWIFDAGGNFLLHEFCPCRDSRPDIEKLFPVNDDTYHLYVVTNAGVDLAFPAESEEGMAALKVDFDYGRFDSLGIPAAGQGIYSPGKSTEFHLKRLAAKYVISIWDATAGGAKPYEFRFSGPDGKVVCRNLAKAVSPFSISKALPGDVYDNGSDVEFLSGEELDAIDSGESVEKTLYLLENVWGGNRAGDVESGASCASYLEITGNARVDAEIGGAGGMSGYCWDKVTCRYVFGSGADESGEDGVRRNTLNSLSLSVTNGILDHCDGWHVATENLVFDGSMEFTPSTELGIRDNDAVSFQAVPKDRWGRNEGIEYTLDLPSSLSDLTVKYRKSPEDGWQQYVRGGSDSHLVGSNQFLLQNFSPDERKDFKEKIVFRSSDGTAFSTLPLNVNNAKGKYLFQVDRGQGYQTLDRLVLSPDGLPFYGTVLGESEARFRGIRIPFCEERFNVSCNAEDGQTGWLRTESAARDGGRTVSASYDAMFVENPGDGYRIFSDTNSGKTRSGTITATFPSYLGQQNTNVQVSQIGLQSSFGIRFGYYGGEVQALQDFKSASERIWNERYAAEHKAKNWNNPTEYRFPADGDHIEFGIRMELKAKLKVTGYEGAVDMGVSYIVKAEISKRGHDTLYDFSWPSIIEPGNIQVNYNDVVNERKWPLTKEAYLEITDFDVRPYMDNEDLIRVECDEEGLFYLSYLDECLETIRNRPVSLHYNHNGVYTIDYLTITPYTDFSLRPQLDLNTIYNLYGEEVADIHLEL